MTRELESFDPEAVVAGLKAKFATRTDAEVEALEESEKWREASRVAGVLRVWGVPQRIIATLERPATTKSCEWVDDWMGRGSDSWCLVLSANKGLGKSTAAGMWLRKMAVANESRPSPNARRLWWPAGEIAATDFYGDTMREICELRWLVLDDLGTEFNDAKGAFQAKLDRILDARYREYRRTVITTNLPPQSFAERYGERIQDRMREGGLWASISGASIRRSA